jgi:hypothetical protein
VAVIRSHVGHVFVTNACQSRPAAYDPPVRRWILLIALATVSLVVGGYLLAVLVPRDPDDAARPTPILVTTTTIPEAEP